MSYRIQVFCNHSEPILFNEIVNFIDEGAYFEDLKILPLTGSDLSSSHDNVRTLEVSYEVDKSPVIVSKITDNQEISKETEELLFVLDLSKKSSVQQNIVKKLHETSQVFVFEFNKESVSEDCWEMLDSVEGFLASKFNGIIYAPDDGFFDECLNHIYSL